jgi:hypothetical protein
VDYAAFFLPGPPSFPLCFDPNVNSLIGPMTVSVGASYTGLAAAAGVSSFTPRLEPSIALAVLLKSVRTLLVLDRNR